VRLLLTIQYLGTRYAGWQWQANAVGVQQVVSEALETMFGAPVKIEGAGRTDSGVHALAQRAHADVPFDIPNRGFLLGINNLLPHDIRITAAEPVADDFHARFAAKRKTYAYRIWNAPVADPFERRYAWHIHDPIDVDAMHAAAAMFEGRHDFVAFQAAGSSVATTEREVFESVFHTSDAAPGTSPSPLLCYEISGTGFLRHMVRIIVGSLVEVGRGRQPAAWISGVIAARDRTMAGPTAPPQGLFLVGVEYGGALAAGS